MLGDAFLRSSHPSITETVKLTISLVKAHTQSGGAPLRERTASVREVLASLREAGRKYSSQEGDPLPTMQNRLLEIDAEKLHQIEQEVGSEIERIVKEAVQPVDLTGGQNP